MPLVSSGVENGNLRELAMARMRDFGLTCRDVRSREVGLHEIHNRVRVRPLSVFDQVVHGWLADIAFGQPDELELIRRDYTANGGWETFLSYEDPDRDILVGLLRLRKLTPEGTFRPELLKDGQTSMVRELHGLFSSSRRLSAIPSLTLSPPAVYGTAVPLHSRNPTLFQHQGIGTLLMEEAERIAREEHGSKKLAVISGIGVRSYYARLGYKLEGPYMT